MNHTVPLDTSKVLAWVSQQLVIWNQDSRQFSSEHTPEYQAYLRRVYLRVWDYLQGVSRLDSSYSDWECAISQAAAQHFGVKERL